MFEPGDEVVLTAPVVVAPGSLIRLEPGDRGVVEVVGPMACRVRVSGFAVAVPRTRMETVRPVEPLVGDADLDLSFLD